MEWVNINVATIDSAEFVGSDPVERSAWLCLLRYCCGQENGGRIAVARGWKDRQWQQLCKVTLREVQHDCRLFRWDGDDLIVWAYPLDKEREVRAKREAGRRTAGKRWHAGRPPEQPIEQPSSAGSSATRSATGSATGSAHSSASCSAHAETEAEAETETETEGKDSGAAAPADPAPAPARPEPGVAHENWQAPIKAIFDAVLGGQYPGGLVAKVFTPTKSGLLSPTHAPARAKHCPGPHTGDTHCDHAEPVLRALRNYLLRFQGDRAPYFDLHKFALGWPQFLVDLPTRHPTRSAPAGETTMANYRAVVGAMAGEVKAELGRAAQLVGLVAAQYPTPGMPQEEIRALIHDVARLERDPRVGFTPLRAAVMQWRTTHDARPAFSDLRTLAGQIAHRLREEEDARARRREQQAVIAQRAQKTLAAPGGAT